MLGKCCKLLVDYQTVVVAAGYCCFEVVRYDCHRNIAVKDEVRFHMPWSDLVLTGTRPPHNRYSGYRGVWTQTFQRYGIHRFHCQWSQACHWQSQCIFGHRHNAQYAHDMSHHPVTHEIITETGMFVSIRACFVILFVQGFDRYPSAAKTAEYLDRSASCSSWRCDGIWLRLTPSENISWMREEGIDANSFIGMPHSWNRRTYLRTVLRDSSKLLLICFIFIPNA